MKGATLRAGCFCKAFQGNRYEKQCLKAMLISRQPLRGIGILRQAIDKMQMNTNQLTSIHADLCQVRNRTRLTYAYCEHLASQKPPKATRIPAVLCTDNLLVYLHTVPLQKLSANIVILVINHVFGSPNITNTI